MRNRWIRAVGVMTVLALPWTARGADHADGSAAALFIGTDTSSDITDIFAWMNNMGTKVNLIMDVAPGATTSTKFSNVVKYVFHTTSQAAYAPAPAPAGKVDIICTFDTGATQHVSCWVIKLGTTPQVLDYVSGDASSAQGLTSVLGHFRVHTGLHDDPFFFNLAGFQHTAQQGVRAIAALPAGSDDGHGCYAQAAGVAQLLGQDCAGTLTCAATPATCTAPQDFFKFAGGSNTTCTDAFIKNNGVAAGKLSGNILAIVVQIDNALVNQGGGIVGVWGATTH